VVSRPTGSNHNYRPLAPRSCPRLNARQSKTGDVVHRFTKKSPRKFQCVKLRRPRRRR
jgi:hypothetical protein